MLRFVALALVGFVFFASAAMADEVTGVITKVDAEKMTITIKTKDGDKDITVSADTKFVNAKGDKLEDGLKGLKEKTPVTITCEKKDGKEVCTQVKVGGRKKDK